MSLKSMAMSAARSYARSKTSSRPTHRPGPYRPGANATHSPKAKAASTAMREGKKLLRKL